MQTPEACSTETPTACMTEVTNDGCYRGSLERDVLLYLPHEELLFHCPGVRAVSPPPPNPYMPLTPEPWVFHVCPCFRPQLCDHAVFSWGPNSRPAAALQVPVSQALEPLQVDLNPRTTVLCKCTCSSPQLHGCSTCARISGTQLLVSQCPGPWRHGCSTSTHAPDLRYVTVPWMPHIRHQCHHHCECT